MRRINEIFSIRLSACSAWKADEGRGHQMNGGLMNTMMLDYGLWEALALPVPGRKFSSASSTAGRKPFISHFIGWESFSLDEKICTFGRHPMYTWFIVGTSCPIITQPLREVLKSLTPNTFEKEPKWNACHFDLFSTERSETTENQFFRMSARKRAKSGLQEKSFQVHLLHISDVFISTSRATIKFRTWERVLLMHFRFGFHK